MRSILLIICLLMTGVSWGCDEDDLTDYEVLVQITLDGKNGWKFRR